MSSSYKTPVCSHHPALFLSPHPYFPPHLLPPSTPVPRLLHKIIATFYILSLKVVFVLVLNFFLKYFQVFILSSTLKCFCNSLSFLFQYEVSILELDSPSSTWWQIQAIFFQGIKKNHTVWSAWTWIMCLGIKFGSQHLFPSKLPSDLSDDRRETL